MVTPSQYTQSHQKWRESESGSSVVAETADSKLSGIRRVRSLNVDTLRIYENCKPALYTVMIEDICCRHTGHRLPYCLLRSPHPAQYTAWPQGAITVLTSCSVQIQHMFFSSLS